MMEKILQTYLEDDTFKIDVDVIVKEYSANRKNEYPTLQECIHALLDGGDTLTELQEKRTAIKNKYPKE